MLRISTLPAFGLAVLLASSPVVAQTPAATESVPAGQQLFLDHKCNLCHTVSARNIAKRSQTDSETTKAPDLSDAGRHAPELLRGFLKKETKIADKEHKRSFKGTEEELTQLVSWLTELKAGQAGGAQPGKG